MLLLKDPSQALEWEDVNKLKKELEKWLKEEKKMRDYPNAAHDRDERTRKLEDIIKKIWGGRPTLNRIATEIDIQLRNANEQGEKEILQDIKEFFQNKVVGESREKTETKMVEEGRPTEEVKLIGRVAPTLATPATPNEFTFWLRDDDSIHLEVGNLVTARDNRSGIYAVGLVSEVRALSDVEGILDSFYAHSLGRPEIEMPTKMPCIMSAKVEVVRRSDGMSEPVRGMWEVSFATPKQIREAYGADISSEQEVLVGFTYDEQGNPVPITIDARYVLGYEAAHINIAGASGVATKTSYALFLLYSLLGFNEKASTRETGGREMISAIAFNVKEADLMVIDDLPDEWPSFTKWKEKGDKDIRQSIPLWELAKENYKIDPIKWKKEKSFKFFAPMHYLPRGGVLSHRQEGITEFN
ncbi:MAG: hypothetical protein ACPLPS_09150, partial [bacterium]